MAENRKPVYEATSGLAYFGNGTPLRVLSLKVYQSDKKPSAEESDGKKPTRAGRQKSARKP